MSDSPPDLIEQILAEALAPLEQRFEFSGRGIADERRHASKATAAGGSYFTFHLPIF